MRKLLCLIFISMCVFPHAVAQQKPILTGHIKGLPDGTKVWIIMNVGNGRDSVISKNGTFVFYEHGLDVGSYNLRLSRNYERGKWKDLIIDNSPVVITATDTVFSGFVVRGSPWANDFTEYERYRERNKVGEKFLDLSTKMDKSYENKDTTLYKQLRKEYDVFAAFWDKMQWEWINNRNASLFTNFLVYNNLRRSINLQQLDSVLAIIQFKDPLFYQPMAEDIAAYKASSIGKMAPLFVQNDLNDKPFALASLRGSYVLVDFWASWCVPCRAENPNVLAAFNRFKEKNLKVVSVSLDDKKDLWKEAVVKDALPWTQLSDLKGWENEASRKYYIKSIPANVLISPGGKIIAKNLRGENLNKVLEELVK